MKTTKVLLILLCLGLPAMFVFAQNNRVIKGKITDTESAALSGVSITAKPSGKGAVTASDGTFTIEVKDNDKLYISSIGYADQTIDVQNQTYISVQLQASTMELTPVVTVGSRGGGRIRTETPVPVDLINVQQTAQTTGKTDLTSLLNIAAPSFNYNKQSGSDGADAIDLATLRGLGPDQTLVLINGKRRHQTAFVALFGTRGRGNSGTDLNAIPEASINRVEILRDGASAQYGSDAIAGVINIVLNNSVKKLTINGGVSGYYDNQFNTLNSVDKAQYVTGNWLDGRTATLGVNYGLPIGKNNGFINFSGDFLRSGKTFRQAPDTNLAANPKALPINTGRRAAGDASVTTLGGMINSEIPIANTNTKFYFFGGYNYKISNAYAYSRNFGGRPDRFPTTSNGNLIFVPGIMHFATPGDTSSVYFNPLENVHITDASLASGFKGITRSGWDWDVSNTIGGNNFHYFGQGTFNASIDGQPGADINNFNDGGFYFLQNTTNADISRHFKTVAHGFTLSFGAEYRYEQYGIYAGEPASYLTYDINKAGGAQGFPGFQPADEVTAKRNVFGAYVDAEMDVTRNWLIGAAARFEHYSDFGSLATFKFDTRYKITHNFNLRGSVSTGYRAPSLQQINFSNTFTNVQGGKLFQVKIAPNTSPITKAAGIPNLKQETSVNASLGFSWKPASDWTFTVDGYMVKMKNRIVLSGAFDTTSLAIEPILKQLGVAQAQFYANAVNTSNYGIDVVLSYSKNWGKNNFRALLAGNVQHMTIDKINIPTALNDTYLHQQAFFSDREKDYVLASAPPLKGGLSLDYGLGKWGAGAHFTYYGKITILGYGYDSPPPYPALVTLDNSSKQVLEQFNYNGKVVSDVYISYKLFKGGTLFIGSDNLFNVHPNYGIVPGARLSAYDGESGGAWDPVQMGFNGRKLYAKVAINL